MQQVPIVPPSHLRTALCCAPTHARQAQASHALGTPAGCKRSAPTSDGCLEMLRWPAPDLASIVREQSATVPPQRRRVGDPRSITTPRKGYSPADSPGGPAAGHAQPLAFVVDHALRPDSAAEASTAAQLSSGLGMQVRGCFMCMHTSSDRGDSLQSRQSLGVTAQPHVLVVDWSGHSPAANKKMAAARDARYAALSAACTAHFVDALLVAHTAGACRDIAQHGAGAVPMLAIAHGALAGDGLCR